MTSRHRCPECGHVWRPSRTRGRPKSAYYEVEGRRLHAQDWAEELEVTLTTIHKWARSPGGLEAILKAQEERPARIVTAGKHAWARRVVPEKRK